MYTMGVEEKPTLENRLGQFMRQWRTSEGLTVEAAADRIGVVKSTWSQLERGTRDASLETLLLLAHHTGAAIDDLARMQNQAVRASRSNEERSRRVAALADAIPAVAGLLALLPDLSAVELDTLLSVAEGFGRRRKGEE